MPATEDIHKVTITLPFEIKEEFLRGILTTALEGGIGYWSMASEIKRDDDHMIYSVHLEPATNRGLEADEFKAETVTTRGQVLTGLVRVAQGGMVNRTITTSVRNALFEQDAGQMDIDDADAIIQAGMFAEVPYG